MRKAPLIVGVLAVAGGAAFYATRHADRSAPASPSANSQSGGRVRAVRSARGGHAPRPAGLVMPRFTAELPPPRTPVIDAITVDRQEVCEGELVVATVHVHTDGGEDDAYLHGSIGGHAGLTVPVPIHRGNDGKPVKIQVLVFGRGDQPVIAEVPEVKIKACSLEYELRISSRVRANTVDQYDFSAAVVQGAYAKPFEPVSFRWDFGDQTSEQTDKSTAQHDYGQRPQDRLYSDFVVAVEATDAQGRVARGSWTLELRNEAFARLVNEREVVILAAPTPRFATAGEDGDFRQRVQLWHHLATDVALGRVEVRTEYQDGRPTEQTESTAQEAFGIDAVPPDGMMVDMVIDAHEGAALRSREYLLHGTSADGLSASGRFVIRFQPVADLPLEDDTIPPPPATETDRLDVGGEPRIIMPDETDRSKPKEN